LIANEDLDVSQCWKQFLQHPLPFWQKRRAILVLDCTPDNDRFTIVFVGILVQNRLLPLAWQVMPQNEEWDEGQWQIVERLFAQVAQFLPAQEVILLADRGLAALLLIGRMSSAIIGIMCCAFSMMNIVGAAFGAAIATGNAAASSCSKRGHPGMVGSSCGKAMALLAS
jgi:hypothetical protein